METDTISINKVYSTVHVIEKRLNMLENIFKSVEEEIAEKKMTNAEKKALAEAIEAEKKGLLVRMKDVL